MTQTPKTGLFRKPLPSPLFFLSMVTVLVFGLGGLLALYIILNPPQSKNLTSIFPVTTQPVSLVLSLHNPEDYTLTFTPEVMLSGTTSPGSVIVLTTDKKDLVLKASSSGSFSVAVKLEGGVNNLTVAAFDGLGNSKSEARTIYYSKEKI